MKINQKSIYRINVKLFFLVQYFYKIKIFQGPVVKQAIVIEKTPDESTPEPEPESAPAPVENPPAPVVTNDQTIPPTDVTDQNEKKEDEQEPSDEPPKNPHIEIKPISACKILHSLVNP